MGALGGGGGLNTSGSSYQSSATSGQKNTDSFGSTFGDVNVGSGAGSGLKLNGMLIAIIGAVVVAGIFVWKRFA